MPRRGTRESTASDNFDKGGDDQRGSHMYGSAATLITRRQTLAFGASLLLGGRNALAQDAASMAKAIGEAWNIRDFALEMPIDGIHFSVPKYLDTEYFARLNTLTTAQGSGLFDNVESALEYVDDIPAIVPDLREYYNQSALASQKDVIVLIAEDSLPIVPSLSDLTVVEIPAIPPRNDVEIAGYDSDIIVACDIFLETIGISTGETGIIVSFIKSSPEIEENINELIESITSKNWSEVISLGERLFQLFVASAWWDNAKKRIGKKLTFRLALRCVPVVGWIYVGAAFLVSIKKNYRRFSFG